MSRQIQCDICGGCSHDGVKFPAKWRRTLLRIVSSYPCPEGEVTDICADCEKTVAELVKKRRLNPYA